MANTTKLAYEDIEPIQGVILGLIASPGILANIFAIIVTLRLIRSQNLSPNIFVFALACVDLFGIITICTPTWLCYIYGGWIGGDYMCDYQGFMTLFCTLGSGFVAACMAIDRFVAVKWPFIHREKVTVALAKRVVISVLCLSAVLACCPVLGLGSFVRNLTGTYCTINWFAKERKDVIFSYIFALLGFSLVLVVGFCNVNVLVRLCKRETKLRSMSVLSDERRSRKNLEKQFSRMMVVISAIFLICWIPFMVRIVSNISGIWISWSADLQASRLLLLNLVLDPFTYVITRQHYRHAIRAMCCPCCPGHEVLLRISDSTLSISSRTLHATRHSTVTLDRIECNARMGNRECNAMGDVKHVTLTNV